MALFRLQDQTGGGCSMRRWLGWATLAVLLLAFLAGHLLLVGCGIQVGPGSLQPQPTPAPTLEPSSVFSSTVHYRFVQPRAYIRDACQFLSERWDPRRSAPGTVVVPVMFHSVEQRDDYQPGDTFIPAQELTRTVEVARELGFQTITAAQLADFLEHNAPIPRLSMIWIVDDRRPDTLEHYFLPIARANHWTVTVGWPIGNTDKREGMWQRMEDMNATGLLDVQGHGYEHRYAEPDTPEEVLRRELFDPIAILEQHFGHKPIAFVWPGGTFTPRAAELAREAGYRLAFSAFSRAPLLYNWIPLGDQEAEVADPLMVLPRFWGRPGLAEHLQRAAEIADAAAAQARAQYAKEAAYYRTMCSGELPAPLK